MAEHVSSLVLDELAARLPISPAQQAHVDACVHCQGRVQARIQENVRVTSSPDFERVFTRVRSSSKTHSPRPFWRWPAVFVPPLAAALLVIFVKQTWRTHPDDLRLKGGVALRVLRSADGTRLTHVKVGERVVLSVATGGHSFARVWAVDASGVVSPVWPLEATQDGRLPSQSETTLAPGFEVTAGSVTLHAFFSNHPLDPTDVKTRLQEEVNASRSRGRSPLDTTVTPWPGVIHAQSALHVE